MKNNILLLLALLLLASCQKQPTANFNTDKTLYYAGETVHLTDASTNAHHWYWTMPDGSEKTGQNVDYVIDTNDLGGNETFALTVTSKNEKKLNTIAKPILISQKIFNTDYYAFDQTQNHIIPLIKYSYFENGNWVIVVDRLIITFLGLTNKPSAGTYQAQSQVTVAPIYYSTNADTFDNIVFSTGSITVANFANGLIQFSIQNVNGSHYSFNFGGTPQSVSLNGLINCY